jgi:arylsulfatase A-like enzyme
MIRTLLLLAPLLLPVAMTAQAAADGRPNVVVILADDLGFSDIGCYGGEIDTPHLDALAAGGLKFSQFYNSARCCPTRAALLTGLHPHQTGIGHMTVEPGATPDPARPPTYRGILAADVPTLAEILRPAGYATLLAGKWHLGQADRSQWPLQRGFDRFYGCLSGATLYFTPAPPRGVTLDNQPGISPASTTDRPYYTTDAFTDHAIRFVSETEKPFFLYLAYTAPHWPIQAHEEDIARYRGKFREGWDVLRERRYRRQQQLGLIKPGWPLPPRDAEVPAWDSLTPEQQDELDLRMAVYAAMVHRMDDNIGKLVSHLRETGRLDNTVIVFLSDNGACAELGVLGNQNVRDPDKRNAHLHVSYGTAWANLSSTPFRLYKRFAHEGGTATPFIVHWPAGIAPREGWVDAPAQVIDLVPTMLDLAGVAPPSSGRPLEGVSLAPLFAGQPIVRSAPLFMEHENHAFIRDGDWKLVGRGVAPPTGPRADRWELYNLAEDRTEMHDLAKSQPAKVAELSARWHVWAKRIGVFPKP